MASYQLFSDVLFARLQVDAHPFKHWYESHYGVTIGIKKGKKAPPKEAEEVR